MSALVNLAPDVRTYVAQLRVDPNFERALAAPDSDSRKMLAVSAMQSAEATTAETLVPKLTELQQQGLVQDFELVPLTGAVIINTPEANSAAAWDAIRGVSELGRIVRNREVTLDAELGAVVPAGGNGTVEPEYNVAKVNAPGAWEQGVRGAGITVGVIDTGIDPAHPALVDNYRGTQADGSFDHSYSFFDPINRRTEAYDDHGHGTHVAGTVAGGAADRIIGMAPDAQVIAAKAFDARGGGNTATILRALSWMLAPTDAQGKNPDPTKAPDIVNNSWGNSNGAFLGYLDTFRAFHAAGIVPVVSAGNSGRGDRPQTIGAPASYKESIAVAATDRDDVRAPFSSVGPSRVRGEDGQFIFKPDIAAPGVAVISSMPGGSYRAMSGTSMAGPGAAGVAALLMSRYPNMTPEQVREALLTGAVDLGEPGPDHFYGHGRIDAVAALEAADAMFRTPDEPTRPDPDAGSDT